jgi:outer membrane protein|tara:strand:+ start:47 stop:565 length:519 start_codon:yes stop_codon:yes gene_type:complete
MKKLFIIFFIFLIQSNFAIANTKVAFVDLEKIINTSKPGSSMLKQLKETNNQILNNFKKEEKDLNNKETKIISQKNILVKEEFETNVNKLRTEIKEYNQNRKEIINNFNKLKMDSTNKFLKMINPILTKYSDEQSISILLHKKDLLMGKTELDITDAIIKIINSEINEFKIN